MSLHEIIDDGDYLNEKWTLSRIIQHPKDALSEIDRLQEAMCELTTLRELVKELVKAGNFMHDAVERFTKEPNWEMLRKWRNLIEKAQDTIAQNEDIQKNQKEYILSKLKEMKNIAELGFSVTTNISDLIKELEE